MGGSLDEWKDCKNQDAPRRYRATIYAGPVERGNCRWRGTYTAAASQTTAGLQKWTFNGTQWNLAYTLQAGLALGMPYTIAGYPNGLNATTGLPWALATDGLRNLAGVVNGDGTATIYAITSMVSGSGDQGADPNKLVAITDTLSAEGPIPPASESFATVRAAGNLEVLRGVSFTPGS